MLPLAGDDMPPKGAAGNVRFRLQDYTPGEGLCSECSSSVEPASVADPCIHDLQQAMPPAMEAEGVSTGILGSVETDGLQAHAKQAAVSCDISPAAHDPVESEELGRGWNLRNCEGDAEMVQLDVCTAAVTAGGVARTEVARTSSDRGGQRDSAEQQETQEADADPMQSVCDRVSARGATHEMNSTDDACTSDR
jgi:hypothetical protein